MMPLPLAPQYEQLLPVCKKKIKYRPFLVKEEKILLLAVEDGQESTMKLAMEQVIDNCTFGKLDVKNLPIADIEFMFIKIREKSVGESMDVNVDCVHCGHEIPVKVQLGEIDVVNGNTSMDIKLAPNIIVTMKYPTLESTKNIKVDENNEISAASLMTDGAIACIEMTTIDDVVYPAVDQTKEEMTEWLDGLLSEQLTMIHEWMDKLPKVRWEKEVKCPHCEKDNSIVLEGLDSFFG